MIGDWKLKPKCKHTYKWRTWTVYKAVAGYWCLKNGELLVNRFKRQQDARECAEQMEAESAK